MKTGVVHQEDPCMATARALSERSQKEHGFLQKNTLSMFGGEGEEFVPSLNGRRKHSYPGSPLCGLLLKYLIRQHHLSTVYLHVPARQPAHICWIRSLTSCWFGSIHSKCQSLKWGERLGEEHSRGKTKRWSPFSKELSERLEKPCGYASSSTSEVWGILWARLNYNPTWIS